MVLKIEPNWPIRPPTDHDFSPVWRIGQENDQTEIRPVELVVQLANQTN